MEETRKAAHEETGAVEPGFVDPGLAFVGTAAVAMVVEALDGLVAQAVDAARMLAEVCAR